MSPVSITTEAATTDANSISVPRTYMSSTHKRYFEDEGIAPELAQAFTVNNAEALPEELQFHLKLHGPDILPGIVFEHVSIRGEVTNQLRPDNVPEGCGKYLFAKGAFNGPFIHRTQEHLVGKVTDVVIVEGTKQFRAAITAATADGSIGYRLFIGIPGCTGGLKEGRHSQDWMTAIKAGATITILFDKDMTTNLMVWKAGDELRKHLVQYVTGAKVKIAELSGYAKEGLDDTLKVLPVEKRPSVLNNIITTALPKMPQKPLMTRKAGSADASLPIMDFENGTCQHAPTDIGNGQKMPGRIILNAAVRIVRSFAEYNDLAEEVNQTMRYDLDVVTKVNGVLVTSQVNGMTDRQLAEPREYMNRIRGGGSSYFVYSKDKEILEHTIRSTSQQEMIEVVERSGLKADRDGVVRFMDTTGALGPDDKIYDLRASITEKKMKKFRLEDPHSMTPEEIKAAFQHIFTMWDCMVDPTGFLLMLGQIVAAVHGLEPKGTYGSFGEPGSGKTTIADMARSVLGGHLKMSNFEATPNAVGMLGAGVENLPLFVDDFQDLASGGSKAVENNNNGLRMMLRRGYGGATYHKDRLKQNRDTDKWEAMENDPASPFFSVTMERNAIPYAMKSGMERMLLAHVTILNSFATPADANLAMEYAKSPLGAKALAVVVLYVLKSIQHLGSGQPALDEWKDRMETTRRKTQEGLTRDFKGLLQDPRSYELPSTPVFGLRQFLRIAWSHDVIDKGEREARFSKAQEHIMKAAREWQDSVTKKGGGVEGHLSKMSDAVASGNYFMGDTYKAHSPEMGRTKVLGWHAKYRGEEVVILIPTEAARICGFGSDTTRLGNELAKYLVTDAAGNKTPSVPSQTAKSGKARLWALKRSVWENGVSEGFDPADHDEDADESDFAGTES